MINEFMNYCRDALPAFEMMTNVLRQMNLGNSIEKNADVSPAERDAFMARERFKVTTPNGQQVWVTGASISDCFNRYALQHPITSTIPETVDTPLFADYAQEWFTTYRKPKLKYNTADMYAGNLKNHVIPFFKGKHVGEITTKDVQDFYNAKKNLSASVNRQCRTLLIGIFNSALEDGLIAKSPMTSTRLTIISKKVKTREPLTPEQIKDIEANLHKLCTEDKTLLALLMYTGMRRGEMLGLRWSDIDFDKKLIHIQRQITVHKNRPVLSAPKSKAGIRPVPLLPELESILRETLPNDANRMDDYIVSGKDPYSERQYRNRMERIMKNINLHGATAHVLRHTFCTMAAGHTDIKTLQTMAGHSKISMTMDRYTHGLDSRVQSQSANLSGMYNSMN